MILKTASSSACPKAGTLFLLSNVRRENGSSHKGEDKMKLMEMIARLVPPCAQYAAVFSPTVKKRIETDR